MTESPSTSSTPPAPHADSSQTSTDSLQGDLVQDRGDAGYNKSLKNRHLQMIAIGGSIGTGLFMGAGGRLKEGGAGLMFAYAICGLFAFLMVRALASSPSAGPPPVHSSPMPVSSSGRRVLISLAGSSF